MNESDVKNRVSIIGMGNVLLGDDCFGPFTVEVFGSLYECGRGIEIIDVGTPGSDLAPYLYGRDLVILVDAIRDDGHPGTLRIYGERDFLHYSAQIRVTNHDPGLQESLAQLRLVNRGPVELVVIGVIPERCDFGEDISPTVLEASFVAAERIRQLLVERGFDCVKRASAVQPTFWWTSGLAKCDQARKHSPSIPLNDN